MPGQRGPVRDGGSAEGARLGAYQVCRCAPWPREVLQDAGKVTAEIARVHAESEFEKYRIVQDRLFESDFDRLLKQIEPGDTPETDKG